jgi:pimeloyl-ACP methyl ester carboxylesterase
MGGYQSALYASQHPEKIEKLFLISPGGMTHYDPATFDKLKTNMMHGDEPWRRYTIKDIEAANKADLTTDHFLK